MSTTIDHRVVEMQFDNSHFERNVSTTMSTLDKLKQKLHLPGATKGLENINTAAKGVNLLSISNAAETVGLKFNAMYTMADQALRNITNSAMMYGKRIVSALTIDPVKTGFSEYETQINAIQTILANTESKGTTLNDVNAALDTLNAYADKTIYNFTEMTKNIGTFTAAGIDLDTSVNAIQGIANLAAVSGSTSQQASTAMYQLSQALASGTVKLMDWNSVVNAGMGGQVFQDALKETARVHGVAIDSMIEEQGSFRETLSQGWLTSEILTDTLQKFTLTTEGLTEAQIAENRAMLKAKGYTDAQIDSIFKLGTTATNAATKVKTFSQLFDTLKETAQSGWTQTWELLVGDFEQSKEMLTGLSEFFGGILNGISDFRNNLLRGALGSPLDGLMKRLEGMTGAAEKATGAAKDFSEIVNQVIRGDFGNGADRIKALTEAGYDYAHIQNLVNERLGCSKRLATDYKDAQTDANEAQAVTIDQLVKMSDAQLKNIGFTEQEIDALRELQRQAEKTGIPIQELMKYSEHISGRTLLLNSFKNAGQGIVAVCKAMKDAWVEIFPPMTSEQLYNIIAGLHKFSTHLVVGDETADKLKRTLKGVFAILDIILTLVGGPIKIAFKAFTQLLAMFDMDILDVTASVGDAIVRFRDWIDATLDFTKIFEKIIPPIKNGINAIREWIEGAKEAENLPKYIAEGIFGVLSSLVGGIGKVFSYLKKLITGQADSIPNDLISGLINGIKNGTKVVAQVFIELGKMILESIKGVLGIHSPSREFFDIGSNIIQGLVNGLQNGVSAVGNAIKKIGSVCVEFFKKIDFGKLFTAGLLVGILFIAKKMADALDILTGPIEGVGEMFIGLAKTFEGLGASLKASAWKKRSQAVLNMAIAIAVLAGAVVILTLIEPSKLWGAVGAIAALAAVVVALSVAAGLMSKIGALSFKQVFVLIGITGALLLIAMAVEKLVDIDLGKALVTVMILSGVVIGLAALVRLISMGFNEEQMEHIDNVGKMFVKIGIALLIMVAVIKLASMLKGMEIAKGLVVVTLLGVFFAVVIRLFKVIGGAGEHASSIGGLLLKMSFAMLLMIAVVKLASKIDRSDVDRGMSTLWEVMKLFITIIAISLIAKYAGNAGSMVLSVAFALLIMVGVVALVSYIDQDDIDKGLKAISTFVDLIIAVVAVSVLAKHASGAGSMINSVSIAIIAMTLMIVILSFMKPADIAKGLTAITVMSLCIMGIIGITKLAKDIKMGTLIVLTAAIGLLVGAIVGLSFLNPDKVKNASKSIALVTGMFAALIASTKLAKNIKIKDMSIMLGAIAILAGIIIGMSLLNPEGALVSSAALSMLILSLAGSMVLIGLAGDKASKASGSLGALVAVVFGLALILGVMEAMNVTEAIESAAALSILLIALTVSVTILSTVQSSVTKSVGAVALLGLVVLELAVILGLIRGMGINEALPDVITLSVLLLALSGATVILAGAGATFEFALFGIIALEALILALVGTIALLGSLSDGDSMAALDTGIVVFEKLGIAIGKLIGGIVGGIVGGLVSGVMSTLPQLGNYLSEFMNNAKDFIEGAKTIDGSVLAGVGILALIFVELFAASIIDGIIRMIDLGTDSPMGKLGYSLSEFWRGAEDFFEGIKNIDEGTMTAVASLAGALLELTAASLLDGMARWIGEDSSIGEFAKQLIPFGKALVEFSSIVAGKIDESAVTAAANAGKIMAEFAKEIPNSGGWLGDIMGENDMDTFGTQLEGFGKSIVAFSNTVSGKNKIDKDAVESAKNAGLIMVELANAIPNTGGLSEIVFGDNDMKMFGQHLESFGKSIVAFSQTVSGDGKIDSDAVESAKNAGLMLAELANTIPNDDSFVSFFVGNKDLGKFGDQLIPLADGLEYYMDAVGDTGDVNFDSANSAVESLAKVASTLPNLSGIGSWFSGDQSLAKLGEHISALGTCLEEYAESVDDIDESEFAAAANATEIAVELADTVKALPELGGIGSWFSGDESLATFGKQIKKFGGYLADYANEVKGITVDAKGLKDTVKTLLEVANDVTSTKNTNIGDFGKKIKDFGGSLKSFSDNAKKVSTDTISTVVTKIKEITSSMQDLGKLDTGKSLSKVVSDGIIAMYDTVVNNTEAVKSYGSAVITNFESGMNAKRGTMIMTAGTLAIAAGNQFSVGSPYAKAMGTALVQGFANGISESTYIAEAAAEAAAKAALDAAKKKLGIQSPSKEFYKLGRFSGMGFTNALYDFADKSYDAGAEVAAYAKSGLSDAVRKISDAINSDMDAQPTIRPVLDLSNVRAGASTIGSLFSTDPSIGVLANVGAINSMMNRRIQNGTNDDVISAINKLGRNIANSRGDQYNIGDVRYDADEEVAEAVKTIARKIKVGKRV